MLQTGGTTTGRIDLSKLNMDDYLVLGANAWVRSSVEDKVYPLPNNKGAIVYVFSDPVLATLDQKDHESGLNLAGAMETLTGLTDATQMAAGQSNEEYTSEDKAQYYKGDYSLIGGEAKKRADAALVNQFGLSPPAVMPCKVAIPMRSNIRPYGPYATSNFHSSCAGITAEVDKDIAPWVFGSVAGMNQAANIRLSNFENDPLVIGTTGNVTIPCLPEISLGASQLTVGPVLNGITVNFGSGGITTAYSFQTFTPRFGGFGQATVEKLKQIASNRREQLKLLRNDQVLTNRVARKRIGIDYSKFKNSQPTKQDGVAKQSSMSRVFIGEMQDWWKETTGITPYHQMHASHTPIVDPFQGNYSKENGPTGPELPVKYNSARTVVGSETLTKSVLELRYDYEKKAFMSMDGFFGPVSISGDGNLPQFAKYEPTCNRSTPISPQPPFVDCSGTFKTTCGNYAYNPEEGVPKQDSYYNLAINQAFENPLQNPTSCHHHLGDAHGHIIDAVGRKQSIDKHLIMNVNLEQDYAEDYRFLGFRGPMVLSAWGYDTWGKPIPNAADSVEDASNGEFTDENLKDRFMDEWLSKPNTWPVGPVDLRFDRDRGVWVSPPQDYKVTVVELVDDLQPLGTTVARLINTDTKAGKEYGPSLWDFEGGEINPTDEKDSPYVVTVEDRLNIYYSSGTRLYAHYDTYSCKYIVFGQISEDIIRFKLFQDQTCTPPSTGDCDWYHYAGYNDKLTDEHSKGVRINCSEEPVDKYGAVVTENDLFNPDKKQDIYVNLYDNVGMHGPAYSKYTTFSEWKERAHNGYAAKAVPRIPITNCADDPCSTDQSIVPTGCSMGGGCQSLDPCLDNYDIIFLEGYARFVHATLLQDLYPPDCELENYSGDEYKTACPCGNASANIDGELFYGNTPNGTKTKYYISDGSETSFRVFDAFSTNEFKSPFKRLKAGDKVLAIFNEKEKKYYIYQASDIDKIIKFALLEDKKTVDQIHAKAVMVDKSHRPIRLDTGDLIESDSELVDNSFYVIDPIAEKVKDISDAGNFSTFGPALGSDSLGDHLQGELLEHYGRGSLSGYQIKPFTGFGKLRDTPCLDTDPSGCDLQYDIVYLENFANYIDFEAAEDILTPNNPYAANYTRFYDGTIPIGRKHKDNDYHNSRQVNINVYDFTPDGDIYNKRPSHIVGEIIGSEGMGCKGVAKLDSSRSTTDKLLYNIVDSQTQALNAKFVILNCEGASALNKAGKVDTSKTICKDANVKAYKFTDGFEWDENDPLTCDRRHNTKIINKSEWVGKEYHVANPSGDNGFLTNIDLDTYYISDSYYIAKFRMSNAHDCNEMDDPEGSACDTGNYIDGIPPDQDCCPPTTGDCWMTYEGSPYTAIWDEDLGQYTVITAKEAPQILEGVAKTDISCDGADFEAEITMASGPGHDKYPVTEKIKSVKNPRGFAAFAGDEVVLHRRQSGCCYDYVLAHVGKPCSPSGVELDDNCLLEKVDYTYDIEGPDFRFFNERIEKIPNWQAGSTQALLHGPEFGLMWENASYYTTKTIMGCWNGSSITIDAFSGFNGSDMLGSNIGVVNPTSCCPEGGSVFEAPGWATAIHMNTASGCEWRITNAECCDECEYDVCPECVPVDSGCETCPDDGGGGGGTVLLETDSSLQSSGNIEVVAKVNTVTGTPSVNVTYTGGS